MAEIVRTDGKPGIIVSDLDYRRLSSIAGTALDRLPEIAEDLLAEMDRANVVSAQTIPAGVVQMGSTVEFRSDAGQARRFTLVFPTKADIAKNRISILTPVGTALIGLSVGQSIDWTARDGKRHTLTVLSVEPPKKADLD